MSAAHHTDDPLALSKHNTATWGRLRRYDTSSTNISHPDRLRL